MKDRKVLITAGPTREYWDPVRYLSNGSTGQMGIAIAEEAARQGASVTLILGPTSFQPKLSKRLRVISVVTGWEMYEAVRENLSGVDVFVGSAAVSDYRPAETQKKKIKKDLPQVTLTLHKNPDIIAYVGHHRTHRPKTVVGFALETNDVLKHARQKLFRKNLDWIVANRESNIADASAEGMLLGRNGRSVQLKRAVKPAFAKILWKEIF